MKQTLFLFFACILLTSLPIKSMEQSTHYGILGVSRRATIETITKTYRNLARKNHPDKNLDNKETAEERFKTIVYAYEILSDPQKRMAYDFTLPFDNDFLKDDIFEDFFPKKYCYNTHPQYSPTIKKCYHCLMTRIGKSYQTPCCWQTPGYEQTIDLCNSCCAQPIFLMRCPYCTMEVITIRRNEDGSVILNNSFLCDGLACKIKHHRQWTDKQYYTLCCHKKVSMCDNCTNNTRIQCPYCT